MHDYVIVGAGSAGCVLAARLSEDPAARVLLLEAGGRDDSMLIRGPGLYNRLWRTKHDWAFRTEAQNAVDGRRMFWPRGKVLGGSSSLNAMIYVRGHPSNYDQWRDLGSAGWGYDEVLPYFKRSENWCGPPSEFHGKDGPMDVRDVEPHAPVAEAYIEAARQVCSVARNDDFNGAEQEGAGHYQYTVRAGRRWSAADAFLHPARSRKNLDVATGARAIGLRVSRGQVEGVRYLMGRSELFAPAAREVIVAAGTVGSPHLLLLSGIGPADHCRQRGVSVVHDLPGVGANLQDHLMTLVQHEVVRGGARRLTALAGLAWAAQYAMWGAGPLAHPPVHAGAFVRTSASRPRPDLQFHVVPWGLFTPNTDEHRESDPGRFVSILPGLIYPKSRGEIRLRTGEPLDPPAIEPRYLTEPDDLNVLVTGIRLAREIAASKPLAAYCGREQRPGPGVVDEDGIRADIRLRANTIFHPVGTCKMGSDSLAVVDSELRVRGLGRLRVVDGSIMPTIVGGNTHAPIVMIAEKAADMIRARAPVP